MFRYSSFLVTITVALFTTCVSGQNCNSGVAPRHFASDIGDIDGDGISDVAITAFNNAGEFTSVVIDRSNNTTITFIPPEGEIFFGVGVTAAGDFDEDGMSDIAIASVILDSAGSAHGIVRVYSSVSGEEVAYIKDTGDSVVSPLDIKIVGDIDQNGIINSVDLLLVANAITTGSTESDPYVLDLNKDGQIDIADIVILVGLLGNTASPTANQALASLINLGESTLDDPQFAGIEMLPMDQPELFGLIGCVWCNIRCAYHIARASDCIGLRKRIAEECAERFPNVCSLEYTECIEEGERNRIGPCIDEVGRTAGSCAKCVTKCVPRPSA